MELYDNEWWSALDSGAVHTASDEKNWPAPTEGWPDDDEEPSAPAPPKGTWFDEAIDLRDPEGDALTGRVLELIDRTKPTKRKRRRNRAAQANHLRLVRTILANGFRCLLHRKSARVAYYRKADGYRGVPSWLSGRVMGGAIDLLARAGLLRSSIGMRGTSSTYEIAPDLIATAEECGITGSSISMCLPSNRLIELRSGASGSAPLDFVPTPETRRWESQLQAYNEFRAQQDIALDLTPEEEGQWVAKLNEQRRKGTIPFIRPERFRTDLRRIFNNGSFDQGGRMYGGWWIDVPKDLRPIIIINGQPTVELDYSGCAIRMLYHERGIDYRDDPYLLVPIVAWAEEQGLKPDHYREGIKKMVQTIINDHEGRNPELIKLPNGLSFRPRFKRREVMKMIEEKHAPIADTFRTGAGLRLQREDSDLALAIIVALMERNIVALPIHDGLRTAMSNIDDLRQTMTDLYKDRFVFDPIIK